MLAGRGVALLITDGFITTVNSAPLEFVASGYLLWAPVRASSSRSPPSPSSPCSRDAPRSACSPRRSGINPEASRLAGVRSRGIIFGAYVVSGTLAGVAGIIYSSNIRAADANAAGDLIELYAILAVVLGGTSLMGGKFTIAGTVIGVLIIQTLESTILFLGVSSAQSPVFFAVVVILVVLIQSPRLHRMARGLTGGRRSRERSRPSRRRGGRRMSTSVATRRPRSAVVGRYVRTFLNRHASLMPTFAALVIFILLLVGAADPLRQLRHARATCRRCCSTTPTC